MRRSWARVAGIVLIIAFVVSWFAWGPLGIVAYIGGLFNSLSVLVLVLPLSLLVLLAAAWLLVLVVGTALRWRRLLGRAKLRRLLLATGCAALVASFTLGFAGVIPSPFDMHVKGFARYARSRTDVAAIQAWLGTLDPNEYVDASTDPGGMPLPAAEQPAAIIRLNPNRYPHGVRVVRDGTGRLMVRLTWGGGMIGHWGIVVGHSETKVPQTQEPGWMKRQYGGRTEEFYEYGEYRKPLAPGAWIWHELD